MLKYFLDRTGVPTKRIAGKPGCGHIEIATSAEDLDPASDIYQQMFAKGYIRVVETDYECLVDAPRTLTTSQAHFLKSKEKEGLKVSINDHCFVETRDKARAVVKQLIG